MIKLAVCGCCGKMGRRIINLALKDKAFELVAAAESPLHPQIGKNAGEALGLTGLRILVESNMEIIQAADVIIEFTNPAATLDHLIYARKFKKPVVIGTTGFDKQQMEKVKEIAQEIPVVFSPNMSLGVNLVFRLVREAAQRLGRAYKIDIVEAHHIHKKDAPSGTAKYLANLIQEAGALREGEIKIDSIREGEIVGEHQVRFDGLQDTIIIKHSAKTRDIFAQGALTAAKFALKQPPGLYDMQDVIENSE